MSAEQARVIADIERLAKKAGLSINGVTPPERDLLLFAFHQRCAALPFPVAEREFTRYVAEWLDGLTGLITTDVVEFRRTLIDFKFFTRDTAGRVYRPAEPLPLEARPLAAASEGLDCTNLFIETRAAERAAREARRRLHAKADATPADVVL